MQHPFKRSDWTTHHNGDLMFIARHPILDDVAQCLAGYDLPLKLTQGRLRIYVGTHSFTRRVLPRGPSIGIQTEQYLDEDGRALWGDASRARILRNVMQHDMVVDLSPANKPAYGFLPARLRRKLVFGPYIFPDTLPAFQPGDLPPVFYGARNPRRDAMLAELEQAGAVTIMPPNLFGAERDAQIARASAVLNLHFQAGTYAEYPRILTALMAGKSVVSEPLGAGLRAGTHYLAPGDPATPEDLRRAHGAMVADLANRARLSDLLRLFRDRAR